MLHHLAFDYGCDHVAQAGVLLKQVFAGLEFRASLQRKYRADKGPAIVVDNAFTLQGIGNIGHSRTGRNIDDPFLTQGAGSLDLLFAVDVCGAGSEHQYQYKRDDSIADHDERIAGALRSFWRRRKLLRLQRGARTAWRNRRPLTHRYNLNPVGLIGLGNAAATACSP